MKEVLLKLQTNCNSVLTPVAAGHRKGVEGRVFDLAVLALIHVPRQTRFSRNLGRGFCSSTILCGPWFSGQTAVSCRTTVFLLPQRCSKIEIEYWSRVTGRYKHSYDKSIKQLGWRTGSDNGT